MLVLAIETATDMAAVALADEGGVIAAVSVVRPRRHAETVVPAVADVCRYGGMTLADVSAVAVDVGPGLFTGLRVGVGAARAFSFALDVPLVGRSSLEVLAAAAAQSATPGRLVVPVVDARRGEVFWAPFRVTPDSDAVAEGSEEVSDVGALRRALLSRGEPVLVLGDGGRRYGDVLRGTDDGDAGAEGVGIAAAVVEDALSLDVEVAGPSLAHPPVAVLATLGVRAALAGEGTEPAEVLPRYLRAADASINWETRRRPAPAREPA